MTMLWKDSKIDILTSEERRLERERYFCVSAAYELAGVLLDFCGGSRDPRRTFTSTSAVVAHFLQYNNKTAISNIHASTSINAQYSQYRDDASASFEQ